MICYEVIKARGHENIKATHKATLEITKDRDLTPRGNCIIGVAADKSVFDLSKEFKGCLKTNNSVLLVVLEVGDLKDIILAEGHPNLLLNDKNKTIIRKSIYIEPATLGIKANKAAADIKRELIYLLKDPDNVLTVHLYAIKLNEITSINVHSRHIF